MQNPILSNVHNLYGVICKHGMTIKHVMTEIPLQLYHAFVHVVKVHHCFAVSKG